MGNWLEKYLTEDVPEGHGFQQLWTCDMLGCQICGLF